MSKLEDEGEGFGQEFTPVKQNLPIHALAYRDTQGATVYRTGRAELNVAGTEALDGVAIRSKLEVDQYWVRFGVKLDSSIIAAYPVPADTEGATGVRRAKSKRTVTIYLHNVFVAFPQLVPVGRCQCIVVPARDSNGVDYLQISLGTALVKRKVKKGKSGESTAQPAQGKAESKSDGQSETKAHQNPPLMP